VVYYCSSGQWAVHRPGNLRTPVSNLVLLSMANFFRCKGMLIMNFETFIDKLFSSGIDMIFVLLGWLFEMRVSDNLCVSGLMFFSNS